MWTENGQTHFIKIMKLWLVMSVNVDSQNWSKVLAILKVTK